MDTEKKELIWVPSKFAKEFQDLESGDKQLAMLRDLISSRKLEIEQDMQCLSDNVLQFKAFVAGHRSELCKAVNAEMTNLESLVGQSCNIQTKLKEASTKFAEQSIQPITRSLESLEHRLSVIDQRVDNINTRSAEALIRLSESLSRLDDKSKEILRDLLNHAESTKLTAQ